ncbi:hypothetical protein IC006_0127 [Sulfuracidifex tepidarius]|uniref:Uncharacterized protein n=1 Tax=Sulfuracidifex tepidarius TaxID=1294262 RepID=A0A510DZE1_9CREN|nr:hypothetical protein IC006_0127 [Sulfuracidifex tepidarius]BBG25604.1 hypothetical protein IC007_0109 [Sulfuracidifex tepidarius]
MVIGFTFSTITYTSTPTVKQDGSMRIVKKAEHISSLE